MNADYSELIRRHCRPLTPRETGVEPRLALLDGIRAVLFDIYGTLLISASGDIGLDRGEHRAQAAEDAIGETGGQLLVSPSAVIEGFETAIRREHDRLRNEGVDYPEIDIVEIWESIDGDCILAESGIREFSLAFELRVNPTWTMPFAAEALDRLHHSGQVLGIVSNAQFFTPLLFPPLLGKSPAEFGFEEALTYLSYEHRCAKPGKRLYAMIAEQLANRRIDPAEVLYVGNDMLNDVMPAASTGFRTALFAGDERSLRLRSDDERVTGVEADIVITELPQILECLSIRNTTDRA